ncbi:folate family ECF transporter S component [Isachenkonia alkalipeptolytica]|uniref:Folate family ECF transporter S component n=1 Tax=Isachenkonia alkalipeptolytica TaxID=2565777 RepID=A0AA44BE50_9CLOT|nr:folate family ECF transporter S component [Isachenkonia alkalipeptolytica]NBG87116.1 folate family ECF transporter S component [Isachenkonia alkalipeptolytica]
MDRSDNISVKRFFSPGKLTTRTLVISALLISMAVVLGQFSFMVGPSVRIGFSRIPIIVSGMLLGPLAGGLTGIVHDLINFIMRPAGGFHPGFTLSAMMTGMIPGFIVQFSLFSGFRKFNRSRKAFTVTNVVTSVAAVYLIVTLLMNTYWLSQLIGDSYLVLLPVRASTQLLANVVNALVIVMLAKPLENFKKQYS